MIVPTVTCFDVFAAAIVGVVVFIVAVVIVAVVVFAAFFDK